MAVKPLSPNPARSQKVPPTEVLSYPWARPRDQVWGSLGDVPSLSFSLPGQPTGSLLISLARSHSAWLKGQGGDPPELLCLRADPG